MEKNIGKKKQTNSNQSKDGSHLRLAARPDSSHHSCSGIFGVDNESLFIAQVLLHFSTAWEAKTFENF